METVNRNLHGSYLGADNPELAGQGYSYAVPPTDYQDYAADCSYITDSTSTTKWMMLGFFYCVQNFPVGFAWLCNIAFVFFILIRLRFIPRPIDIIIFSIGLMLAIYPLLNNGEICNFTENDNKHVVEVAKLGLGYYLWLASMATMFACLIKQYLKNKKQRHTHKHCIRR